MTLIDAVGFVGVTLLLIAYFLQLYKKLTVDALPYILLNLVGASLACLASWWIAYYPFVVLEGTWATISGWTLWKYFRRPSNLT